MAITYTVLRPSDGESLSIHDNVFDAENDAINYAVVDDRSIVVERTMNDDGVRIIIAVAHPSGALFRTVGTPGGRVGAGEPIFADDLEVTSAFYRVEDWPTS